MGRSFYRSRSYNDTELKFYIGAFVVLTITTAYFMIFGGAGKMAQVVYASSAFWFMTLLSFAIGLAAKFKHPEDFTWPEYVLYGMFCANTFFGLYALMFTTSTDLVRKEIWNGKATSAHYQEAHTDKRTETTYDSKGRANGTRTVYYPHSAEYSVESTAGDYGSNSTIYRNFKNLWGNETSKFGSCASAAGPFLVYTTRDTGRSEHLVPVSLEHRYVNFVTASDTIKKLRGEYPEHKANIREHPHCYSGDYGPTEFNRVVTASAPMRQSWANAVDTMLDRKLVQIGPSHQCNVIVYVVGSGDQKVAHALEAAWKMGEKNDIVVVVGAPNFPEVEWAYVMAWTDVEEFKITLRDRILALGKDAEGDARGIGHAGNFVDTICSQITASTTNGGFKRKPMSDYDYLIAEIGLPWWATLLIVLIGGGLQAGAATLLIRNGIRD